MSDHEFSDNDDFPFANCAEEFGNTTFNLYYSSPSTLSAVAALLGSTRHSLMGTQDSLAQVSFLDLGCGDGRFVIHMAKHHGIRGTGVDFSPSTIAEAVALAEAEGVSHLCTFLLEDFTLWECIPTQFTWVSAYVPKTLLSRLRSVVEKWLLEAENEGVGVGGIEGVREPRLFVSVLYKMRGWEERKLVAKDEVMTLWVADKLTASG
ncbi:hypothetical protein HDU98_004250 [Podochytrium sp. JEL0797]|nr:hypothetical protein HDU98_004250 [Podochytrium sp. JEL0797]